MSFHLLVESRDFDVLRGVVEHLFSSDDDGQVSVIIALGPQTSQHTWLTVDDPLGFGVNFYGTLAAHPPAARWWEFATTDGAITFAVAYSPDTADERWSAKGKSSLPRVAKDAGLPSLTLPDRETGEVDGTTTISFTTNDSWERTLAKALGVPARKVAALTKRRPPKVEEPVADAWTNFNRSERIVKDPRTVLAAAPKKTASLVDELDRLECLWRVGKKTEAQAGLTKLRLSGDKDVRFVADVTSPTHWIHPNPRYLPDFSLALVTAHEKALAPGVAHLRRAQALAALGDKKLLPALETLFASGVPSSLSWDEEIAEAISRMKKGPLKKAAATRLTSLR